MIKLQIIVPPKTNAQATEIVPGRRSAFTQPTVLKGESLNSVLYQWSRLSVFGGRQHELNCNGIAPSTVFETGFATGRINLPSGGERVRTMPTPYGAIRFQTGAGALAGSLSKLADGWRTRSPCPLGHQPLSKRCRPPDRLAIQSGTP